MDNFKSLYSTLTKTKLECESIYDWFDIDIEVTGSGGSSNIIFIGKINDIKTVLKCIPLNKKSPNQKKVKNNDQLEIVFYKYFTKKYILKDITPHLVGIYNHKFCHDIHKFLDKKCPSFQEVLTTKNLKKDKVCDFLMMLERRKDYFRKEFDVCMLEYCPLTIDSEFEKLCKQFKKKKINFKVLEEFIYRVIFQTVYTVACLQKNDKHFTHNDLFLRNILGVNESSYKTNDYVEYNIFNKSFYLPANGFYSKINDFGYTLIYPKMKPNIISDKFDYKDQKSDVFNFLHDFYDGQNFGAKSVMKIYDDNKFNKRQKTKVKDVFNNFIKTSMVDKINVSNKMEFNWIWNISNHDFLQDLIKTPKEYLTSTVFNKFNKLPPGGKVVKTYSDEYYHEYKKYKTKYLNKKN